MRRTVLFLALFLLPLAGLAQTPGVPEDGSTGEPGLSMLDFGFGLQLSDPYPSSGQKIRATLFFFNLTDKDADGAWANVGGFGCRYYLWIRDRDGNQVWGPQTLCPLRGEDGLDAPVGPFPFPAGTFLRLPVDLSLVYHGNELGERDGAPLPGGAYMLEARHDYSGPVHHAGQIVGTGGLPFAQVPFRILNCSTASGPVDVREIGGGEISYIRYADPGFHGHDFVLRTQEGAMSFWEAHTSGITPTPKPPEIDWDTEMVLVSLMGYQTSGGGPSIRIGDVEESECHITANVTEFWIPGPLDVITNPFHAVAVPRSLKEVYFEHFIALPNGTQERIRRQAQEWTQR